MSLLPQFGFVELLVIAMVALIVVGPRELPSLLKKCGVMVGKARRMAGEFTAAFDQMANDVEMDELREEMESLKYNNVMTSTREEINDAMAPIKRELNETGSEGEKMARGLKQGHSDKNVDAEKTDINTQKTPQTS